MYGYHDIYFNQKRPGFRNSIWIELIGFDHTQADFGVQDFLSKTGFLPDMVSLHLTSICFVLQHRGMEQETLLPKYACSYNGHAGNDDRRRQPWTNHQMAGLIAELPEIAEDYGACHINEVKTSPNTSRLFLDNEEYWYATPLVRTKKKIRSLRYVTKPACYPIQQPDEYSFRIRVPGFGMDIIEITYDT